MTAEMLGIAVLAALLGIVVYLLIASVEDVWGAADTDSGAPRPGQCSGSPTESGTARQGDPKDIANKKFGTRAAAEAYVNEQHALWQIVEEAQ